MILLSYLLDVYVAVMVFGASKSKHSAYVWGTQADCIKSTLVYLI